MQTRSVFRLVLMALVAGASAAGTPAQERTVSGSWRMTITFDQPVTATLELKQDGAKVTGRFIAGFAGGPIAVEGDFDGDELAVSGSTTTGPHPGVQLDFTGSLTSDTTMKGTLSWPVGDFAWTAEKAPLG